MNGVHDMGGLHGFGPVLPEPDEPTFHHPWERRAFALTLATGALRRWNLDQSRAMRERLPPAEYLASSYYRIWFSGLIGLMQERGFVTQEEIADGRMHQPPAAPVQPLVAAGVAAALSRGSPTQRSLPRPPRYAVGDPVRTRNLNSASHTRLPRYCRGKPAVIAKLHGAHVFPDSNALGRGEDPQWLYTLRFDARDLWGADTTATAVHVDCWEPYLEPL